MPGRRYDQIYEIAADQLGFVTTGQARAAGINPQVLVMMERRNVLRRTSHGVYRLLNFPETEHDSFMEAVLWPAGVSAVVSHESALLLYDLGDVNPAAIHISVPGNYRTARALPEHIRIHVRDLAAQDTTTHVGLPVTTPEQTIRDCRDTHLGPALVNQAISLALRGGLISEEVAASLGISH